MQGSAFRASEIDKICELLGIDSLEKKEEIFAKLVDFESTT